MKSAVFALAALALVAATPASANLATNGSFETGDFTGWTQFGDTSFTGVTLGSFYEPPTDGSYQAVFGPVSGYGGISQAIADLATRYLVSFDLGNVGGAGNYVDFGGTTILSNVPGQGFVHYSFLVDAPANPTLAFGFYNPPSFYTLDNVQVEAVATPLPATIALMGAGLALLRLRRRAA